MKFLSACDAKYRFGYMIDAARQEPLSVEKHRRLVVVVLSIEDYARPEMVLPTIERESLNNHVCYLSID